MGALAVPAGPGRGLDAFREQLVLTPLELWLRYLALGGDADVDAFANYLSGEGELSVVEHNTIAVALNDQYMELGLKAAVPYLD